MSQDVRVHFLPSLFQPDELAGGIAVIIDVLRASTTITHALAEGAESVWPCQEVDDARRIQGTLDGGKCLLGGERHGQRIDGFDLDNSPLSYIQQAVAGKQVVFTTTNGTKALLRAARADRVLIGSFVNLAAIVREMVRDQRPVHLVCAGTDGMISAEDCLCAGAMVTGIRESASTGAIDDQAEIAAGFFESHSRTDEELLMSITQSRGGRNLQALGYIEDIRRSACRDLFDLVPEFFPASHQIRAAN